MHRAQGETGEEVEFVYSAFEEDIFNSINTSILNLIIKYESIFHIDSSVEDLASNLVQDGDVRLEWIALPSTMAQG